MRMITGAILILAGAVLCGCGVIADAIKPGGASGSYWGGLLIFIGLFVLAWGIDTDRNDRKERRVTRE